MGYNAIILLAMTCKIYANGLAHHVREGMALDVYRPICTILYTLRQTDGYVTPCWFKYVMRYVAKGSLGNCVISIESQGRGHMHMHVPMVMDMG